jgi:RHS repeat-associated protein
MWYRVGWGGWFNPWLEQSPNYVNNQLTTIPGTSISMSYDAAGNLTNDGYQTYTYDATGQQTAASGTGLTQSYDGDGLRVKKVESGATTYYLRSSLLGGQVISELGSGGSFQRGYVYLGTQMLAIQKNDQVSWVHQDPITKSQRLTNSSGTVTSIVDLDPWGGETARSSNQAFQPHRFTTYERDANGGDEAMMRRYAGKWHRFAQPDPFDGSYDFSNPQSFNRYAYVQNDPVNFVDPLGLDPEIEGGLGNSLAGLVVPHWSVTVGDGGDGGEMVEPIHPYRPMIEPGLNPQKNASGQDIPVRRLLDNVFQLLDDNRCSNFVSDLINVARQLTGKKPYTYDVKELAVAVARQADGGFIFRSGANGGGGGGSAYGDIFSGQATVEIVMFNTAHTGPRDYQGGYALAALHELIHLAGGAASAYDGSRAYYMDVVLARAAKILTGAPGYPGGHDANVPNSQITAAMTSAAGTYWNDQLKEHCMPQGWRAK